MNLDHIYFAVNKQKKVIGNFMIFGIIAAPFFTLLGYSGFSEKTLPTMQRYMSAGIMILGPLTIIAVLYEYFIGKKFYDIQKHPVIDILKNKPESIIKVMEVGNTVSYADIQVAQFISIDIQTKDGKMFRLPVERKWLSDIYKSIKNVSPEVKFYQNNFLTRVKV